MYWYLVLASKRYLCSSTRLMPVERKLMTESATYSYSQRTQRPTSDCHLLSLNPSTTGKMSPQKVQVTCLLCEQIQVTFAVISTMLGNGPTL